MRAETLHAIVLLAIVGGLALAGAAAYETTHPSAQQYCSVNSYFSCAKVDQSAYTSTFGVPDWLIGVGGFLVLLAIDVPFYRTWHRNLLYVLLALSVLGVGASAYFAYVEVVQIQAVCPVCFSSYVANFVVLGGLVGLYLEGRETPDEPSTSEGTAEPPTKTSAPEAGANGPGPK